MKARLFAFAAAVAACHAFADLDKIDADGVTETGGDASYARMLPRTGADGKLSASFLPPVTDWTAQPVPKLYYIAGSATSEGNGAPQYPFKTLQTALNSVTDDGAAFIVAPGSYSGSITLSSGRSLTLFGFGGYTQFSSLNVSVSGTSGATSLAIVGASVGTLNITGGKVNVRLLGTRVAALAGTSSQITVTRADMGASVSSSTVESYVDTYTGYATAPNAMALVGGTADGTMVMSGQRAKVGEETVAYVSDIAGATNSVYATIGDLRDEDARLEGLIGDEATVRTNADLAIYAHIGEEVAVLDDKIDQIGSNWGTQLSLITARIGNLSTAISDLDDRESGDIEDVNTDIALVRKQYAAADTELKSVIEGEISDAVEALREDVPGIADTEADARIAVARDGIVADAVEQAGVYTDMRVASISNSVTAVKKDIAALEKTVSGHTSSISALDKSYKNLVSQVSVVSNGLSLATGRISALEAWKNSTSIWMTGIDSSVGSLNTTVAGHTTSISSLTSKYSTLNDTVSGLSTSMSSANTKIASLESWKSTMSTWKTSASSDITTLKSTVSSHGTSIASLNSSYSTLNTKVTNLSSSMSTANSKISSLESWESTINSWKTSISSDVGSLKTTVSGHTTTISTLSGNVTQLGVDLSSLSATVEGYNASLDGRITILENWRTGIDDWKSSVNSSISAHKSTINAIIDCLTKIKEGKTSEMSIPSKLP